MTLSAYEALAQRGRELAISKDITIREACKEFGSRAGRLPSPSASKSNFQLSPRSPSSSAKKSPIRIPISRGVNECALLLGINSKVLTIYPS